MDSYTVCHRVIVFVVHILIKIKRTLTSYILEFQKFIISSKFHSQKNYIPLTLPIHQPPVVCGHRSTVHGQPPILKKLKLIVKLV